jgi:hypothetical protein
MHVTEAFSALHSSWTFVQLFAAQPSGIVER